jgi:predicted permease
MPDWTGLIRRQREAGPLEDDVVEEIAHHAEELYQAALARGETPAAATAAVEREVSRLREVVRSARAKRRGRPPLPPPADAAARPSVVTTFGRDLGYGLRLLLARRAFSAIAILTLALGIGANTAIFSVINTLLLQPLPFADPERLVMLWEASAGDRSDIYPVAAPNYRDWASRIQAFEQTAIWESKAFNLTGNGEAEQVRGMRVSASAFPLLRVQPQLGRTFSAEEDGPGHDVVIISDALWRRRFGGRPDVVGRTMGLNGRPFEIVGVMPPSFRFMSHESGVWVPIQFTELDEGRSAHSFLAAARIKAGVSFEAARRELETVASRMEREYLENRRETATITPMSELGIGPMRKTLLMLLAAVALVLVIACVNVANLLLAQGQVRQREFAVRAALGAGRGRLASQLVAEGLVLAGAGGAAGVAIAWIATNALSALLPAGIRFAPFRDPSLAVLDPMVLQFTAGIAIVAGALFSLAPVLSLRTSAPGTTLKEMGMRGSTGAWQGLRGGLLAAQIALAIVVLSAAGLLVRSMSKLLAVDPGLEPRNVLVLGMALPQEDTYGEPVRTTFCSDVAREVGRVPGIASVSAISHLPLSGANAGRGFVIEGRPSTLGGEGLSASYRVTCPGYFSTLGIPMIRGRDFTEADTLRAPMVAIVNQLTADTYWPGADPVGQRIKFGSLTSDGPWMTVVGVVANVRHFGLDAASRRELFRPYSQRVWPSMTITVKGAADPRPLTPAIRRALAAVGPDEPIVAVRTMNDVVEESLGSRRFPMLLLSGFSAVALLLAAVGVYGVVSYLVSQRTREIGIRVALGARPAQVTALIVARSLLPIGIGVLGGLAGALAATRAMATMLYETAPHDPAVLASIVALLTACALMACVVPARRAARVDPLVALRQE